jgi:threonine aldolase
MKISFLSDNTAPVHPKVMDKLIEANSDFALSYGYDTYTKQAEKAFNTIFETEVDVFFVNNGTSANVLSLQTCALPHEAIVCSRSSHIHTDECGAPERYLGSKLLAVEHTNGKLTFEELEKSMIGKGFEHHVQPKVISLTQNTEYGTVYKVEEIKEIVSFARKNECFVHVDGARLANAAARLQVSLNTMLVRTGVDVVSFGGTKNGLMQGEAVVFINKSLSKHFLYQRKQAMQLSSKMRYLSAQWIAYFENNLWLENAQKANNMAENLSYKLSLIKGIKVTRPTEANAVFVNIPENTAKKLMEDFPFYCWDELENEYRLMCSWNTQYTHINQLVSKLETLLLK